MKRGEKLSDVGHVFALNPSTVGTISKDMGYIPEHIKQAVLMDSTIRLFCFLHVKPLMLPYLCLTLNLLGKLQECQNCFKSHVQTCITLDSTVAQNI